MKATTSVDLSKLPGNVRTTVEVKNGDAFDLLPSQVPGQVRITFPMDWQRTLRYTHGVDSEQYVVDVVSSVSSPVTKVGQELELGSTMCLRPAEDGETTYTTPITCVLQGDQVVLGTRRSMAQDLYFCGKASGIFSLILCVVTICCLTNGRWFSASFLGAGSIMALALCVHLMRKFSWSKDT